MLVNVSCTVIQSDTIIYTNHFLKWDEHPELAWDVHGYRMLLQGCKARCGQSMTTQKHANGTNNQEYHEPMNGSICIRGPFDMTPTICKSYGFWNLFQRLQNPVVHHGFPMVFRSAPAQWLLGRLSAWWHPGMLWDLFVSGISSLVRHW